MSDTVTDWKDGLPQARAHPAAEATTARAYTNPYVAGIGLGLVLLAAFVVMGRGLGASGAFAALVATMLHAVAPEHVMGNEYPRRLHRRRDDVHPLKAWLVFEVIGVVRRRPVLRSAGATRRPRDRTRAAGVGGRASRHGAAGRRRSWGSAPRSHAGARAARRLTGGALLNLGSWAFMLMVFAGAYAVAYFVRWQWK